MSNDFFNPSGTPAQGSQLVTPNMRAEFAAIAAGFDKLPTLTGNAYKIVYINAAGVAMDAFGGAGLLKLSTTGAPSIATAGTDYTNLAVLSTAAAAVPNDADLMPVVDGTATKKLSLANLKAFLKTYFDGVYTTSAAVVAYVSGLIGSTIQAYDVDTLKADTADVLTAGFATTPANAGTKSSGTFTPDEANGNQQYCVNGGAFTLAPPTNPTTIILEILNNGSAGAITTSGFTKVVGSFATTNGYKYVCNIIKTQNYSLLQIQGLQ